MSQERINNTEIERLGDTNESGDLESLRKPVLDKIERLRQKATSWEASEEEKQSFLDKLTSIEQKIKEIFIKEYIDKADVDSINVELNALEKLINPPQNFYQVGFDSPKMNSRAQSKGSKAQAESGPVSTETPETNLVQKIIAIASDYGSKFFKSLNKEPKLTLVPGTGDTVKIEQIIKGKTLEKIVPVNVIARLIYRSRKTIDEKLAKYTASASFKDIEYVDVFAPNQKDIIL